MTGGIKWQKLRCRIRFTNTTYVFCRTLAFWDHLLRFIRNSLEIQNSFAGNVGVRRKGPKTSVSLKNYKSMSRGLDFIHGISHLVWEATGSLKRVLQKSGLGKEMSESALAFFIAPFDS